MKHIDKLIGILLLLFAIGFNLWIYRQEPTAQTDPNDNTFQFALVERTNQIWDFAVKKCSSNYLTFGLCHLSFLVDHWVPNWAQGYNLPYYYSHVPQIFIVASWRLVSSTIQQFSNVTISLYSYYHFVIYILLSLFPLSLFIGLRIIGVSWLASGFGALIATQLSTDGLYGLDLSSFLWRGWGLSSQLFAMIWLPLAIAYGWKWLHVQKETNMRTERQGAKFSQDGSELRFQENFRHPERSFKHQRVLLFAILFLAATTAGHLGIGIIAFLSVGILSLSNLSHLGNLSNLKEILKKLLLLYGGVFLLLGYWIFPILLGGNYHNISVWDSIWKFDSFGYREVLKNLFNGDLFDFGRLPILTTLAFIGLFSGLFTIYHLPFTILFLFWLLLYFGRTTWGGLFNLIPGMSEFHLSRFIVGIHIAGLFLIPIGFEWLMEQVLRITYFVLGKRNSTIIPDTNRLIRYLITGVTLAILFPIISGQTLRYSKHNDFLIKRANENYEKDKEDVASLLSVVRRQLSEKSGRVFAGRGGSWGRNFRIAETPIYMHLSTYGIPVILWLPETWSPNSDTEQYFSENNPAHYALYNVRYVVTPTDLPKEHIQPFWRLLESGKSWRLYEVSPLSPQSPLSPLGYITTGVRPAIVSTSKTDYRSLVRLWMHSDYPSQGLYPELTFDKDYPKNTGLPNFRMLDEVTYSVPAGTRHNLFADVPRYQSPITNYQLPTILSQESNSDMIFRASVDVPPGCTECLVILRQSFHPSWRATIDGKPVQTMTVFPFYIGVSIPEGLPAQAGTHEIVFSYEPSLLKKLLLILSLISFTALIWLAHPNALYKIKAQP